MSMEQAADSVRSAYWRASRRPLTCLVFVAPMLLCYELGVLWLGPDAMRNGADVWLRGLLQWIGFGQYFLLPLVTCAVLLGWHHVLRQPWSVSATTLLGMLLESCLLAGVLLLLARLQARLVWSPEDTESVAMSTTAASGFAGRLVAYCGAGIYEELLFRLLALPLAAFGLIRLGVARQPAWAIGLVATSLLFALAHYDLITVHGEPFDWFSFSFRFLAGCFFASLFVFRGFGIAAGAHACYDILIVFA